jgi:hypothetical protein
VSLHRSDIEHVRLTIKEDLGDYPENIFQTFDPEPIASASLAQVCVCVCVYVCVYLLHSSVYCCVNDFC